MNDVFRLARGDVGFKSMKQSFGFADYLLYVDYKAIVAVEAKAEGTLTDVGA